jgi:DNA repair exonuclease SbcCD nuclease subunit
MKFIAFSDIHFHVWGNFNTHNRRVIAQMEIVERVFQIAHSRKCPILFLGDMFHDPDSLSNDLLSMVQPWFIELFNKYSVHFFAISGNHDMKETNSFKRRSPSYINTLSNSIRNFQNLDFHSITHEGMTYHGVPYITHNEGIMDYIESIELNPDTPNILLLHTDFRGQKDTNGMEVGKGTNINEKGLKKFDVVLSGHIHKPGKLRDNIYSVGSPCQLRVSDMGGEFGYWICRDNLKMDFKSFDKVPEFKYYSEGDKTDDFNFWVKKPISDSQTFQELKTFSLTDKQKVTSEYLNFIQEGSKTRKRYLLNLIKRIRVNEEGNI